MANAIANTKPEQKGEMTLKGYLSSDGFKSQIALALPKHLKADRMIRVAITAITKNPKLQDCDQASFFGCMHSLSAWGLEPDGRRAALIPFGKECTLVIMYQGLAELAYRSGIVKAIHSDLVRDGDLFEYDMGQIIKHVPHFLRRDTAKPREEGSIYAAYCTVLMDGGVKSCAVMSTLEINAIRDNSPGYKTAVKYGKKDSPWMAHWGEMAKKTVFRRVAKWLPLSAEFRDATDGEDEEYVVDVSSSPTKVSNLDQLTDALGSPSGAPQIEHAVERESGDEPAEDLSQLPEQTF